MWYSNTVATPSWAGLELLNLKGTRKGCGRCRFLPAEAARIVSGRGDKTVRVWGVIQDMNC